MSSWKRSNINNHIYTHTETKCVIVRLKALGKVGYALFYDIDAFMAKEDPLGLFSDTLKQDRVVLSGLAKAKHYHTLKMAEISSQVGSNGFKYKMIDEDRED